MLRKRGVRITAIALAVALLLSVVASAALNYDLNGDGKTNVWDLQMVLSGGGSAEDQKAALNEALAGSDELHKNAEGQWEIWTSLGLYNMAKNAQAGDTFVLMQDIDMEGASWTPIKNFNGKFIGSEKFTVSNMKITQTVDGNMGFFASVAEGGSIYRLNLADMNIIASADAKTIGLVAATCAGKIDSCTAIGFLTDERTAIPENFVFGGLVGRLADSGEIATHVENMLYALGQESEIPNISAKIGARAADTDAYVSKIGIVGDAGKGTVDPMALLENLTGIMPNPNAIAWVSNGDVMTYPINLTELLDAIQVDGHSVITLQKDLSHNATIEVPYSSTWDLNGYTIRTNPKNGYGLRILAAGTDNKVTTVKNGALYHYGIGIRVDVGGVVVTNMKIYGTYAPCIGIYDPSPDYNGINLIDDCELYHSLWGVFTYNEAETDYTNVNITVRNSKLVAYKAGGSALFVKRTNAIGGNVTLGYNVDMYTYGDTVVSGNTLEGVNPVLMEETANVNVDGVVKKGLKHWTTNESVIATEVIAEVTNGDETTQVTNISDLISAVSSTGNTKIKLMKDIVATTKLEIPYSCIIDLNGYSITSTSSNALRFRAAGTDNNVAFVKNGTLNHYLHGIRMDTGSLNVSGVTFNSLNTGSSVGFYDPNSVYRANNKIDNCYIYNPKGYCVTFAVSNTDFSNTGVTITNSTLLSPGSYVFGKGSGATAGIITLGEHVELYSKKESIAPSEYRYSGMMAGRVADVSVTAKNGSVHTGLYNWSTDRQTEARNMLMLGNSLSLTVSQELHEIAKREGIYLNMADLYHAGAYGWQHQDWITRAAPEYEFRIYNDMGYWFHGDIKTVNEAVDYLDWDYVSYQEFFTAKYASTYDSTIAKYEPHVKWVLDYLKSEIPDAEFYFYQHWSYQVGHATVPDTATQTALFDVIRQASTYFADKYDVTLVPCGEAWQLARADSSIGDVLCNDDNLHPSALTGGQYINGCVFFEVIFKNSCIGDTWRASNGPSEEMHQALQQYAHQAVAAVYGDDYAK